MFNLVCVCNNLGDTNITRHALQLNYFLTKTNHQRVYTRRNNLSIQQANSIDNAYLHIDYLYEKFTL